MEPDPYPIPPAVEKLLNGENWRDLLPDREVLVMFGSIFVAGLFLSLSDFAKATMPYSLTLPMAGLILLQRWQPRIAEIILGVCLLGLGAVLATKPPVYWWRTLQFLGILTAGYAAITLVGIGARALLRPSLRAQVEKIQQIRRGPPPPPPSTEPRTLKVDQAVWIRIIIWAILGLGTSWLFVVGFHDVWPRLLLAVAGFGVAGSVLWALNYAVELTYAGITYRTLFGVRSLTWDEIGEVELRRKSFRLAFIPRAGGRPLEIDLRTIGWTQSGVLIDRVRPWMRE